MEVRAILLCIATCTVTGETPSIERVPTKEDNVCSSEECLNIASELSKLIDPTIDPCEDFYQFACGNFLKSEPVDIHVKYNEILREVIHAEVISLIEAGIEPSEPKPFKLVKRFYKSCIETEAKGLEPLRKFLRNLGGWPVVEGDSWDGKSFDWRSTISTFRREQEDKKYCICDEVGYLARFVVERDRRDPSKRVIALKNSAGLLSDSVKEEDFDNKDSLLVYYYRIMVDTAQMLGADINRAMSEICEIISFEIKLIQVTSPLKRNYYKPGTIAQWSERYPSVPWVTYFQKVVPTSVNLTNLIVNVPDPKFYVNLEALMLNTSKRVQANYVMSKIALKNALFSTKAMRETAYRTVDYEAGGPTKQSRLSYCVAEVMDHLGPGIIAMYADKFLNKETKDAANTIVTQLRWQLKKRLEEYNWRNPKARQAALEKTARLIIRIGYPDIVLNHSKVEELYVNLEFTDDDYVENMNRLLNYHRELGIKELTGPPPGIDELANLASPLDIITDYHNLRNTIHVAPGHLRGLFFDKNRPQFMNYGAFGSFIGHKMSRAFFEPGLYRGNSGTDVWYSGLSMMPGFDSRARCLIGHDKRLIGKLTLWEDLADLAGMSLAYDAYVRWAANKPKEPKLRGLEKYSTKQMFWISAASKECEKIQSESIPNRKLTEQYSIGKFRVISMFSNMPEFAKDFNCNATSLMNPARRCDIW